MHFGFSGFDIQLAGAGTGAGWFRYELLDGVEEMGWREMRIPERHADVGVPEQLLDRPDVYPLHHEVGCEGVAEVMPAEVLNAGALHGWREDAVHEVLGVERRLTSTARKHPFPL